MAVCVSAVTTSSGVFLSPSSTAIGSCVDYALFTASEYASLTPTLTPLDVVELGGMVSAVWALAWSIKILRRTL